MNDSTAVILKTSFDWTRPSMTIETSWWIVGAVILLVIAFFIFRKGINRKVQDFFTSEATIEIDTGLIKYQQTIKKNYQTRYVANRIYIELVSRKAAIPFNEQQDVIKEIYDSWYALFGVIRDEIKSIPGEQLVNNESTEKLIDLSLEILNIGLRPHLTQYQAEFRKWYGERLTESANSGQSPQEIQRDFPRYPELAASLLQVNATLIAYSNQLKKIIRHN